jgi:MFS family permease
MITNYTVCYRRTIPAYAADRFLGRFNVMIAMAITTTVLVFAIWIPASSNAGIVVFAALFGFTSGTIVSMAPALVAQISDVRRIGVRTGTMFTIMSIAVLISNPIAGALVVQDHGGYVKLQVFAGCMMAGGSVFLVLTRIKLTGFNLRVKI